MQGHILVVGSLNMDLVVRVPHHPVIGETVISTEYRRYPGGKGANQAVAAARLGSPVKMIGRAGQDAFGDELVQALASNEVDTSYIYRDEQAPSGVAFVTVDEAGQNFIVVAGGANSLLTPQDIAGAEPAFEGAAILLLQLECPLVSVEKAIHIARRRGIPVVLNPAPAQLLESDLLEQVDYLIPNQSELAMLAGQDSTSAALRVLQSHGVRRLVVTLSEKGALVVDGDWQERMPTYHVPVVDTTAAGDAFVGAFAVALREGLSLRQATAWGNAGGALAVTRMGAMPSLPTRAEFDRFLVEARTTT
jgi:ribokinase